MMLGGVPDSRFARSAALEFAFRTPFVNYWCVKGDMSTRGLVFSKMLNLQQTGSASNCCSPFGFRILRVARRLLFYSTAMQGGSMKLPGSDVTTRMEEVNMWMRACAACRRILRKASLCDHIRCECGWEW